MRNEEVREIDCRGEKVEQHHKSAIVRRQADDVDNDGNNHDPRQHCEDSGYQSLGKFHPQPPCSILSTQTKHNVATAPTAKPAAVIHSTRSGGSRQRTAPARADAAKAPVITTIVPAQSEASSVRVANVTMSIRPTGMARP